MNDQVEEFVKRCKGCLMTALPDPPNPLGLRQPPTQPWQAVCVDYKVRVPGNKYLFLVVDYYSRYIEYAVMTEASATNTIKVLAQMFSRWGIPELLQSDNGPQFTSKEFRSFLFEHGISHHTGPPYWPQENGQVERQNRSIGKRLQIAQAEGGDWELELSRYIISYHNLPHPTTGVAPSARMCGRTLKQKLISVSARTCEPIIIGDLDKELLAKFRTKEYVDMKRHARESQIKQGDTVLLKNHMKTSKMDTNFGPTEFKVVERKGNEVEVESEESHKKRFRRNTRDCKVLKEAELDFQKDRGDSPNKTTPEEQQEPSTNKSEEHQDIEQQPQAAEVSKRRRVPPKYLHDYSCNSLRE